MTPKTKSVKVKSISYLQLMMDIYLHGLYVLLAVLVVVTLSIWRIRAELIWISPKESIMPRRKMQHSAILPQYNTKEESHKMSSTVLFVKMSKEEDDKGVQQLKEKNLEWRKRNLQETWNETTFEYLLLKAATGICLGENMNECQERHTNYIQNCKLSY